MRALQDAGATEIRGNTLKCPFHDDNSPSGYIRQGDDGAWRFRCYTPTCGVRGDVFDVIAESRGMTSAEVLKELRAESPAPKKQEKTYPSAEAALRMFEFVLRDEGAELVGTYEYTHPETRSVELVVGRFRTNDGKTFRQVSPRSEGWAPKGPEGILPLYNRTRVARSDRVVVVEGEKDVHSLLGVGIVATTSPGAANSVDKTDWTPLAGKSVIIWPDNDDAGEQYRENVTKALAAIANPPDVAYINAASLGLPEKADASDFIAMFGPEVRRREVDRVLAKAIGDSAGDELHRRLERVKAGELRHAPSPWRALDANSRWLKPETITMWAGDPGDGKSLMMLNAALYWHASNVPFAFYAFEGKRHVHTARLLAILSGNGRLTDEVWCEQNPVEVDEAMALHRDTISSIGKSFYTGDRLELPKLAEWIDNRASDGARVIVVDPITMAKVRGPRWEADEDFIEQARSIVERNECSLILVTHPKLGGKGVVSLEQLAGGSAYSRFVDCAVWMQAFAEKQRAYVSGTIATETVEYNRKLRVLKQRHGGSVRRLYAFSFDQTLAFVEQGAIIEELNDEE